MPRISNQNRAIAVGLLEAGTPVKQASKKDGCKPKRHKETVAKVHGDWSGEGQTSKWTT